MASGQVSFRPGGLAGVMNDFEHLGAACPRNSKEADNSGLQRTLTCRLGQIAVEILERGALRKRRGRFEPPSPYINQKLDGMKAH